MNGIQISQQHAGRDIYNVARDLNITQNSKAEDVLEIFEAIRQKVDELDLAGKDKKKISDLLENAKNKLKDKNPDKKSIAESIKKINEILREANTTGENLKDIGKLVAKAAAWLGVNAAKLGLIF